MPFATLKQCEAKFTLNVMFDIAHLPLYNEIERERKWRENTGASVVTCLRPGKKVVSMRTAFLPADRFHSDDFHLRPAPGSKRRGIFKALSPVWESKYKFLGGSK